MTEEEKLAGKEVDKANDKAEGGFTICSEASQAPRWDKFEHQQVR